MQPAHAAPFTIVATPALVIRAIVNRRALHKKRRNRHRLRPTDSVAMAGRTLTRGEVAKMLGVSRTRVRQLEGHSLHPKRNKKSGVYQFDRAQVLRLVASRTGRTTAAKPPVPGHLVAHVFRLFRADTPLVEIVMATELDLATIKWLYDEYTTPLGAPTQADGEAKAREAAAGEARARREAAVAEARARREADQQEAVQQEWERERRKRRAQ